MREPEIHPLFDKNITWLNIQKMEQIRSGEIHRIQDCREEQFRLQSKSNLDSETISIIVEGNT